MGAAIQLATLLLSIVPSIIQTVVAVEQAVNAPKSGTDKLALVVNAVISGLQTTVPDLLGKLGQDKVSAHVSNVVNDVVSTLNKLNIFKKSA